MPEEKHGEYARKYPKRLKDISMGTIVMMARDCGYTGKFTTTTPAQIVERKPREIVKDETDKIYDIVELVFNGASNRIGDFRHLDGCRIDGYQDPCDAVDTYHSVYLHSLEIVEYFIENGSISGYGGAVKSAGLQFDYDCKEDLNNSLDDARTFINKACTIHGCNKNDIDVWFTGSKGFCTIIREKEILDLPGAKDIPDRIKKICSYMADGLKTFDRTVYDRCRIWRVPNTINSKTGLYKIPLTLDEFYTLNIDEIKLLAKSQRKI